jgi:pimeloyl-ACP methyl ester carboxylesterase
VICYDTRGHGASSAPKGPYTIDQLGLDVIHILDHLNISKASFCGISMGGLTGQWLAFTTQNVLTMSWYLIQQQKSVKNSLGIRVQHWSVNKV